MSKGRFGVHGGQYIPETLMNAMLELEETYKKYKDDPEFKRELTEMLNEYAGRPSRLYYAERMTKDLGGAKIYLKREDLNHTGAHKINNVIGQMLLAKRMGKTRVIAETGAGQHGVATATVAAMMGMECEIYMGEEDTIRQALNVYRMRLLGAKVHPVKTGTATLKDCTLSRDGAGNNILGNRGFKLNLLGAIRMNGKIQLADNCVVSALSGTYNFDPSTYVDTNTYAVSESGGIWTVTAK